MLFKLRLGSPLARLLVALGIGVVLGLATFGGLAAGFLNGYRLQVTDTLHPSGHTDDRLVVVAIDSRSISETATRWPWPRALHAELVGKLAGAELIVYDVLFHPGAEGDEELAAKIGESRAVLSSAAEGVDPPPGAGPFRAGRMTIPVPGLAQRAEIGHANVTADPGDGVVRSHPLLLEDEDGEFVPSLSLAALMRAEKLSRPFTVRPRSVVVGRRVIPTGPRAVLDIAYAPELRSGVEEAPVISAVDILRDRVPRRDIERRIVLIGVTDPALGDERPTPVAKSVQMPGVLIQANALNTMLTEQYLFPASGLRISVAAGALAGLVALVTLFAPVLAAPVMLLAALAGYVLWTFVQFDAGNVLDLIYPPLGMVLAFVGALGVRYFTELKGRRRVSALFSQYVPKAVANELLDSGRVDEVVRGQRLEVTALFCDLRAFTATSASLEPPRVRDLLNIYYDDMSRIVHEKGGTLLTYVGDEVFAAWGAPVPDAAGAGKAVACARAMQDASDAINGRLAADGLPPITYGIGLHTGEVIAAHVGSVLHRQYTILGDTVNCASRLCTTAGRNEIVVSAETYEALDDQPPAVVLPGIRLKGVGRDLLPHRLWPDELRDPTGEERRGKIEA